ncbi:roundabout homolog 4 isoform X1 [Patagioenas fasciata]|uniref:roundabout homolog 4 isoform X1 n=1 Tax=Patagioenas fasciata TaxID=372321 RepID=UPI0032E86FA3
MAGGWAAALALGLCLAVLRRGGCHLPETPQPAAGKDRMWVGDPKKSTVPPRPMASPPAAALRDNFRLQPGDLVATVGQALELDCVPPSGHPEPRVTWKKDGVTLDVSGGRYVVTEGKLRVTPARRSDSGLYVCVAANAAGERESRGARVAVLEKPTIVRRPSDVVAAAGDTVELGCDAQGDPVPRVQWHKERGDLPWGRHEVDQKYTLRLFAVTPADGGTYVCTAQSQLGSAAATAHLHVEERPPPGRWDAAPRDLLAVRLHLDNGTTLPAAAVRLRWQMLVPAPTPEGYVVLYRCLHPTITPWFQQDVGRELSATIPTLRRGHKYEFKVRPYSGGTQGLDSNTRHLWIPEEVPSAAPQRVTVGQAETGNGTVVVSWEPPPDETHNGIIQGYQVWSVGEGWQRPTNRTVDGGTHRLETLPTTPGARFCVQVAAFNGAGLGVPSNATCGVLGLAAGSTGVARVLRQPVVIAATGSLLWVALLAILLLLCQRRAGRDAAAHRRLVAGDSPWLSGPWKPGCAPPNLSSSSSLSSHLLDPHPSTLSLELPSIGPPTPPVRGGHPSPPGDTGGHPGVRTTPSTPSPAPWERICKPELHQVYSTPLLTGGHVPGSGGEWGTDLGLVTGWPQRRGRDGDTATAVVARGDPRQLPVFNSPKPRRGSASLASGVTGSPVTPPAPPRPWHPPVTRCAATVCHRDMSPMTRCPKDVSPATSSPRDMSPITRYPKDVSSVTGISRETSPVTRNPKDMSPVTGIPRDLSLVTRNPKDMSPVTGIPRDMSPATRCPKDVSSVTGIPRDMSPTTKRPKDVSSVARIPRDTSPATQRPRDMSPVTESTRNVSSVTRHPRDKSLVTKHPKDTFLATRHPKEPPSATRHQRDTISATRHSEEMSQVPDHCRDTSLGSRYPRDMSPASRNHRDPSPVTKHQRDMSPASGHPRDMSPVTRLPKEKSPATRHRSDTFLATRYPKDKPPSTVKDTSPDTRHPRDTSPVTRHPQEMSPVTGHRRETFLANRYPRDVSPAARHPKDTSPATGHPQEMSPVTGHRRDVFLANRYPKDMSPPTKHPRDMSPVTGRLSPALSDGVLTPQQVAEDLEMDQDTTCPSPPVPTTPRFFSPLHTYGYIYGPPASELGEEDEEDEEEEEERPVTRGSPGGSLLNGWGSVSEDNFASARCSLVSSCDGSFLLDASFARALAVAVDGLGFGLGDIDGGYGGPSPPPSPSPLESVFSPGVPIPTWEWGTALGVPRHGGHGSGNLWARGGGEQGTEGTAAWMSPRGRTRQGQSPLSSAKMQFY